MMVSGLRVGLLYYLAGEEHISVALIDPHGTVEMFSLLNWEATFPLTDALVDALDGPFPLTHKTAALDRFSRDWGRKLLPPPDRLESFDILVVIPHYSLYRLPFHVVRLGPQGRYLASSHGIVYCTSGSLFRHCVARNAARHHDPAAWEYSTAAPAPGGGPPPPTRCLSFGVDVLYDKTDVYQELAEAFARFFPEPDTDHLLPRFSLKQPRYDVVCVVCHGHYDEAAPDNCGLLLNNPLGWGSGVERPIVLGNGEAFNFRDLPFKHIPLAVDARPDTTPEYLTVGELKVEAGCDAELVALLGCSTAAGWAPSADALGTLAEQWLRVGAASVLANLWEADLTFLRDWVGRFLTNWVDRRQPKAIAWREAINAVLHEHPEMPIYHWAPVVLLGDWL